MLAELTVGIVVIGAYGRVLEGPVHPLDLPVGPGWFGFVRRCSMPCLSQTRSNMCRL